MTSHRNSPRRRIASKRIRRIVADVCRWLRHNPTPDAADRALTAMQQAERERGSK